MRALVLLACAVPAAARATPAKGLGAPVVTTRPQGALGELGGEGATLSLAWRAVPGAAKYRVTLAKDSASTDVETVEPKLVKRGLAPGKYQVTIVAIDKAGVEGVLSDTLPLSVIEVRAIPPGATEPAPPTRGAYAVGTRFSVASMHCELGTAPIDDLLVGPENEVRILIPGIAKLRCAGMPGYLEKDVLIAPVRLAAEPVQIPRGEASTVHVTLATVAQLGPHLDAEGSDGLHVDAIRRTPFGLDVDITTSDTAQGGTLAIKSGTHELGRVALEVVNPPWPVEEPEAEVDWKALDLGAQLGVFVPPASTTIGHPTAAEDAITGGPLVGGRVGFFPTRRVGVEGEASLVVGGYAGGSGISQILLTRLSLAVRAVEQGRVGIRLFGGAGASTSLRARQTSSATSEGEIHGGAAVSVAVRPNLWLRFQLADVVTTARDAGYAHCLDFQLGIVTRLGRRDSF